MQSQLRDAELEQSRINRDINRANKAIANQRAELEQLEARKTALEKDRDEQQTRIALELRTAWQMGQQGQIKVLLNQESPDTVARVMAYYRYFFRARNELLNEFRATLEALQSTEQRIATTLVDRQPDCAGYLDISLADFDKPVLFTSTTEGPTLQALRTLDAAHGALTPDLEVLLTQPPLSPLSKSDKALVWTHRHLLCHYPETLPTFLHAVDWAQRVLLKPCLVCFRSVIR